MANNATIGLAVAGGYLLGRTRKAKMAIGLGMFVAGRKWNVGPQLGKLVADSPVLGELSQAVRSQLIDATTSAASAALTRRANSFADALHERTLRIGGRRDADSEEEDAPESGGARARAEAAGDADDDRPPEAQDAPRRRTAQTRRTNAVKTRTASQGARRAGGARKAATGGSRKTVDRGGRDA